MRGEVIVPFRDKFNFDLKHEVGEEVEFDDERMETLFAYGYCKRLEEQKTLAPSKPKAKKESKKKVLEDTKEDDVKEEVVNEEKSTESEDANNEPDEKAKSEQEAQAKIAEALAKAEK